ncbi:terminase small subunit [Pseudomonas sp. S 311-6]|uniref:terminase small subunit n=1 Tax=Kerstersia similis TaxID=206505 RepID=UPI0020983724|nr:terminase small subunit [Pseudomonas sp. S 311-6]
MIDLSKKTTQARFAAAVGVTQPVISGLLLRGILTSGDTAGNWLLAYCDNLREQAAGRVKGKPADGDGLDLEAEKARLAAAQADKIEMENEVRRGEVALVSVLETVLSQTGSTVSAILDSIPSTLKRRISTLSASDVLIVETEIARARNAIAALSLEDIEASGDEDN